MSVFQNLVIIEDSKALNKIMKNYGINPGKQYDQTKPAQFTALFRSLIPDIDGEPRLVEQSVSKKLFDILQILGTDEQQTKFKTGNLEDESSSFIYDETGNQIGYILETETSIYKIKKKKFVLNVELIPRITHCYNHRSRGTKKWCNSIHLGNVLVLNINGNNNFYFVIPNEDRTICYCINYLTAKSFFDILNKFERVDLRLRENIISQFRTRNIDLHEITIEDLEVSDTTLDDYEFSITATDNSNNAMVKEINDYLNRESEGERLNPDIRASSFGFGRKKESRKKDRRKAKLSPKGKPVPKRKHMPKATKKRKKKMRKTK